ncbi:MAG: hypothetical protein ABSD20_02025 [Terriglobales bacterium]
MKTKTLPEQTAIYDAMTVLFEHLEAAKAAKFTVAGQDYLIERDRLFVGETVASLTRKVRATEKRERKRRDGMGQAAAWKAGTI